MYDSDDISTNPSDNRHFSDVLESNLSRRNVLGGAVGVAAVGFLAGAPAAAASAPTTADAAEAGAVAGRRGRGHGPLLGFKAVPTSRDDEVHVPEGYIAEVLIPWGTPLLSSGPAWKKDASNTADEQAKQIGFNHDGMHFFPIGSGRRKGNDVGLLVLNHEYTDPAMLTKDGLDQMTLEKARKHQHAHGVSVVKVQRDKNGSWKNVDSKYNRRVHVNTPVKFSGPVKGDHPKLAAKTQARGTLNNCSMGATPWGTYVTCEENWHQYFGTTTTGHESTVEEKRYGVGNGETDWKWHEVDERFDVVKDPNEPNRFGWCVEIDPFDPNSTPVKRTALGRIKHENCHFTETKGRIVAYTGDDQDGEYIYKFVGSGRWRNRRMKGQSPLDHGTLYVARFNDDGSGDWLPLVFGKGKLTKENGFVDQADVLIRTRTAADALGATKMDRPEWITENQKTGHIFCTLTNGSSGPSAANPRKPNPYGHIIRWMEKGNDKTSLRFNWDIFVLAGDPVYDPKVNIKGDIFGSPDGLWGDPDGRLWIQTDVSNSSQLLKEKGYDNIGNNMMLCADPKTKEIRRFLTGPKGCEITGVIATPDQRTMFVNIQHPGEDTKAIGTPTPENPNAVSSWPHHDKAGRPRPATIVIRKKDGGIIGS